MAILDVPESNLILMNLARLLSDNVLKQWDQKDTHKVKIIKRGKCQIWSHCSPLLFVAIVTNISYRKIPHPRTGAVNNFE